VDLQRWFLDFITSPAFWVLCLGGAAYLFKEAMGRALDKRVESHKIEGQQQTERLRSELQFQAQRDVERLKSELQLHGQHQLEQLRAELSARNEAMRHELQKQFLRAELATTKAQEVYPELMGRVLRAEGAIGALWGSRWVPDFKTYSTEQLTQLLKEARPAGEEEKEILDILEHSKKEGIKRIEKVLRRREVEEAKRLHVEASNYLLLQRLFINKRVRELTDEVLRTLWSAWTNVHMGEIARGEGQWHAQYQTALDAAAKKIGELEEAMRADLLPARVGLMQPAAIGAGTE
jgi:hypothetical protein